MKTIAYFRCIDLFRVRVEDALQDVKKECNLNQVCFTLNWEKAPLQYFLNQNYIPQISHGGYSNVLKQAAVFSKQVRSLLMTQ